MGVVTFLSFGIEEVYSHSFFVSSGEKILSACNSFLKPCVYWRSFYGENACDSNTR
jgi:hypothetical protein